MYKMLEMKLLYVEDDRDTRGVFKELLENKIRTLYVAKDGFEALEIFTTNKIDLIISDYNMPKMSGNELCKKVKVINSSVPFVILTSYSEANILIDAIDAGVDKFLQKPIQAKALFSTINDIYKNFQDKFELEKMRVCIQEAEKIALLSYWDVNLNTKKIHFSQEAKELFSLNCSDESIDYLSFAKKVHKEDRVLFHDIFERRIFEEKNIDKVIRIITSNKKYLFIHVIAKKWTSSTCGTNHLIGIFQDVSHYEYQNKQLLDESRLDPMLQIANKKYLVTELKNLMKTSQRYALNLGVLFFDIDNFKHINEEYSHLKADQILKELVTLVEENTRGSDLFGRWGGDEFVIVTEYNSQEATIMLAHKLLKIVNAHTWSSCIKVSISIGVAFYEIGDDAYSLIEKADLKMLDAKHNGKNQLLH